MKMRLQSLFILVFFITSNLVSSQNNNLPPALCGTGNPGEDWERWFQEEVAAYKMQRAFNKDSRAVTIIPVIVHVLHNKKAVGTAENISAAQIQAQIDIMNDAFSGKAIGNSSLPAAFAAVDAGEVPVQFCLAIKDKDGNTMKEPGINRIDVSSKSWGDPSSTSAINSYATLQSYFNSKAKPATIWDPTKYLNIWIGNFITNSGGYLGYATFPPSSTLTGLPASDIGTATTDGVVMTSGVFGNKAKYPNGFYYKDEGYIYGITSLHEVGHYLGLRHISADAACGNDYCDDTPPQKGGNAGAQNGLNWRCPTHPWQANSCSGKNPDGEMFQNFMDYSDDACRSLFTADQETRMMAAMQSSPNRKLLGTHGLCVSNAPTVSNFSADRTHGCSSLTVQFKDESAGSPTSWLWDFGDGSPTSTQQSPLHTYTAVGKYTVKLTTSNQYGGDTKDKNQYIVIEKGTPFNPLQAGPVDNTLGAGGNFNGNDSRGLLFDVEDTLLIESVKVYASGAGERMIQVLDGVGGAVIHSKTINVPDGESRVTLGFNMLPGDQYFMKISGSNVNLYRNNAGAQFPYIIQGLISITQTDYASTDPNYYYYFYDWKVSRAGCDQLIGFQESGEVPMVRIHPNPAHNYIEVQLQKETKEETYIAVLNYLGQVVQQPVIPAGARVATVDIHALPRGIYLIKIYGSDKIITTAKVIKL